MKEGFTIVTIPAATYKSCNGCKYLERERFKCGATENTYNNHCTHPDAPQMKGAWLKGNIDVNSSEQPRPPYWCPFLKK